MIMLNIISINATVVNKNKALFIDNNIAKA